MLDSKYSSEAIKSELSISKSPTKVAEGTRWAAKEQKYLDSVYKYTGLKKTYEYLEISYRILNDISFQTWNIYYEANKNGGVK